MSSPTTGTTLEILAPYLPYGIPLATPKGPAKLVGLNDGHFQCPAETLLIAGEDEPGILSGRYNWDYKEVTPLLLSLPDLCTPLPDGTVPACHVAMLLANDWAAQYSYAIHEVCGNRVTVRLMQWNPEQGETLVGDISILANWNFFLEDEGEIMHFENVFEAYTYLRSNHFAVGLTAEQYIRKEPSHA